MFEVVVDLAAVLFDFLLGSTFLACAIFLRVRADVFLI
jgi:hypothetical protein